MRSMSLANNGSVRQHETPAVITGGRARSARPRHVLRGRDRQGYRYVGGAVGGAVLTGAGADGAGAAVEYGAPVAYGAVGEV